MYLIRYNRRDIKRLQKSCLKFVLSLAQQARRLPECKFADHVHRHAAHHVTHINHPASSRTALLRATDNATDLGAHLLNLLKDDGLELIHAGAREQRVEQLAAFSMQRGFGLGEEGVRYVEDGVEG